MGLNQFWTRILIFMSPAFIYKIFFSENLRFDGVK